MQKFLPVKLAVLAAAALLLTGCPTAQKAQEGEVQQQAQASKGKIDTICVVRHQNAQLGNEKLVKARPGCSTRVSRRGLWNTIRFPLTAGCVSFMV